MKLRVALLHGGALGCKKEGQVQAAKVPASARAKGFQRSLSSNRW
jgi:hypothetical protein